MLCSPLAPVTRRSHATTVTLSVALPLVAVQRVSSTDEPQGSGARFRVTTVNVERCAHFAHPVQLDNRQLVVLLSAVAADSSLEIAVEYFLF